MKKWITLIAIFIISLSTLSVCSSSKSLYSDEGQVFRKVIPQDMTTLDTALITDAVSGDIVGQAFEGLYSLNKQDKAEPAVATNLPKKK